MSSSQSPLSPVSVYGENCAHSLAPQGHFRAHSVGLGAPPLPTVRGAAGPLIGLAKRETGRARSKEKGAWMRSGAVALRAEGGRRIGACSDLALPSGTLGPSARSVLPSRGGWCPDRRGAKPHLTSFSFTVSRCGAPSISVTSVPLVPPSARSACPQGARRIRKRQSRQRLRSRYALPGQA